jgi:hypothetical protein
MKNLELRVNSTLLEKIYALCRSVAEVEWSGHLIYTMETEGDTTIFHPYDILLADIGTIGHTEYEPDGMEMINYMAKQENFINLKLGHIHSHNKMNVFFSGDDMGELEKNKDHFDGYLSVIVNNGIEIIAKFSQKVREEAKTVVYKSRAGDCTITYPAVEKFEHRDVNVKFINPYREKIDQLKAKAEAVKIKTLQKPQYAQGVNWRYPTNAYPRSNQGKTAIQEELFSTESFITGRFIEDSIYSFLAIPQKSTLVVDTFKIAYKKDKHGPEKFIGYLKSRVQYPLEDMEIIDEVTSYLDQILATTRMESNFLDQFNDALFDYGNKLETEVQWDSLG